MKTAAEPHVTFDTNYREVDPLPVLPPNQSSDLGDGEYAVFMKTIISSQLDILPHPLSFLTKREGRTECDGIRIVEGEEHG